MKKKLLPICAIALLTVGYSSVASADTGTVTKEEATQLQQDKAKKEAAIKEQQKIEEEKKRIAQEQLKNDMAKKEEAIKAQQKSEEGKKEAAQVQQKNAATKKEEAKPAVQGEKLPNTASNNVVMMGLSACLVAIGTLFGLKRRNKVKA
ncbi:LPXTG-domain-containing protein cell wall anchor domain [Bacillus cereus ISP3191]|uniref:LPXTG cell wall anchor domain-containing protein n=1 Tax=Bacillus cereus group TaxID=86661 RepID=UPI00016B384F|nr:MULTISPECIES: LPXTG cell wall anchor domain-containing protein [Bacillus cereus group]EDX58228.1 cell wall surface anchor family protein [Bacillus cereus W]MDR4321780.1 LPXTG cell wall anchor domain-containing protein [Bacillus paranthracis]EJQ98207.1 LPXTG-domain-containing protein cell wall anchor domain [Bacillus cereus ISP3191]MEB9528149.1 LPXTG cell wall anchor domain-containing protein [Bacillus anthracis]MEC0039708.1 LPXTG cell wall anchor domain-containing protein [Bacillus anthraci